MERLGAIVDDLICPDDLICTIDIASFQRVSDSQAVLRKIVLVFH
ncbi:hypothetical protein YPPY66_2492 [Yersinia pestis PY-66]|nr:hypothetical protein YPPY15_2253 [Yersinia pestis PY-15]EIR78209.1 hypothetical protein YPPY32_2552 [Yersinia pestis PY-32]EIR91353.1 hypothetical protein YPPY42_2310 [Yersinia pestis PY-42]EIS18585.1 hypothetical protein YPPY52_2325 [Yersinia pestis PY-52]EIS26297.1 hypothetical protein YPPY54_2333 [Yersinia pestis PY-54]EIS76025.1 hypothetical protein YPPY66_2492 [Yersinia pestis PY-66]EIT31867.1 hypothetical protein YPPY98_2246 [Yersinia pestis PY-98]EIT46943.1 hypothetical protein YPP